MSKICCVYHRIDLDGWMSAAIVKYWFESDKIEPSPNCFVYKDKESVDFIGYSYGDEIPDLSQYDKVIMCDISFPSNIMLDMWKKLIWIDHHISAIKQIEEYCDEYDYDKPNHIGLRDTKFAACELTWKYFFPDKEMPEIVRLLGMYDSFRHKGTDEEQKVLEFQYGARQCITNYEEAYAHLIDEGMGYKNPEVNTLNIILDKGKSIYQYLCTEALKIIDTGFSVTLDNGFENKKFLFINRERFNPENFGINYEDLPEYSWCIERIPKYGLICYDGSVDETSQENNICKFSTKEKAEKYRLTLYNSSSFICTEHSWNAEYDGVASFYFNGSKWSISLYSHTVDCSQIAKQYGGGGHSGAAGFLVDSIENLING